MKKKITTEKKTLYKYWQKVAHNLNLGKLITHAITQKRAYDMTSLTKQLY